MLSWFYNDGGPLLVVPEAAAAVWEGNNPPSGGRNVEARFRWSEPDRPASDYDRACDVQDAAAVLPISESWGVVLGDVTSASAAWLSSGDAQCFHLIGVACADDDSAEFLGRLAREPRDWTPLLSGVALGPGGLLLMHAASHPEQIAVHTGQEGTPAGIGEGLRYPAPAGVYDIATCLVDTDTIEAVLVRFTSASPRAPEQGAAGDVRPGIVPE